MVEFEKPFLRPIILRPVFISEKEGSSLRSLSDEQIFALKFESLGQRLARRARAIPFEERSWNEGKEPVSNKVYSLDDEALDWILELSPPPSQMLKP